MLGGIILSEKLTFDILRKLSVYGLVCFQSLLIISCYKITKLILLIWSRQIEYMNKHEIKSYHFGDNNLRSSTAISPRLV